MEKIKIRPIDRVYKARDISRIKVDEIVDTLFTDFFEQKGDGLMREDSSIYGGIALFHGKPVTVIGHRKGKNIQENIKYNFGMASPEGYRKALRLMLEAEKFNRPIITFIDTPGAYPGLEAEMNGQSQAIAKNLAVMSRLKVPIISIVTGEGSSGGALGIGVANKIFMLENAIYSVLSPEGFASILWKDAALASKACDVMKITANDLYAFGIIEGVISEEKNTADNKPLFERIDRVIEQSLVELCELSKEKIVEQRYNKFRYFDDKYLKK